MALAIPIPEKLLSFLMEKVAPVLQAEAKKLQSVPELLDDIKNEMEIAKDYLKKVEVKVDRTEDQTKEQLKLVTKLRALVFKIEDIMDDFKLLEPPKPGNQQGGGKGCFGGISDGFIEGISEFINRGSKEVDSFKDKRGMACSIVRIKKAMEKIKGKSYEESIFSLKVDPGTDRNPSEYPLYKDEEDFVGFKDRQSEVINKLDLEKEVYVKGLFVLAVWGQPGLGKTTLVQKVYENKDVRKNFSCYAWITATKPYKSVDLLKCLFKQFISNSSAGDVKETSIAKYLTPVQNESSVVIIVEKLKSYLTEFHPENR